ncbi:MAG TPA: acetate--CoA ligase family protein [Vicinamibacterales bacterium]
MHTTAPSLAGARLHALFSPKSVALVGASTKPHTVGNDLLRNLLFHEYSGTVYPINPKAVSVLGVPTWPSLSALPHPVDLAVVVVPAPAVLDVADEAIATGVKAMVVLSAGFKEVGGEGAELERRLREKVRAAGIPLVGPNCLGLMNTDPAVRLDATFARKMPMAGKIAFMSQSGALCTSVLDYAEERCIGFSKFISFGNKADISETDLLEYLAADENTNVIAMYLEDVSEGRRFLETAREIFWKTGKAMLGLKSGRSPEGAKAASSHTGSLAGSDSVYDALMLQSGVQRVETIAELFDYAALYASQPMPKGNRLAIVTNAGGPGIMATDAAIRFGLKLAPIGEATKEKIRGALPPSASLRNPIDVIGDARAERYRAVLRTALEDPSVDMGMVILTPQSMTDIEEIARVVPDAVKDLGKPVVCSFMGARDVAGGVEILRKNGVPNYPFPEDAARALAAADRLVTLHEVPDRETPEFPDIDPKGASAIIAQYLGHQKERYLTQVECRPIFEAYRLPLLKSELARTEDEAAAAADAIGRKVVMKVMSSDVVHKYDAGGVILNVRGGAEARAAWRQIHENVRKAYPSANIQGVLVEEMARKGVEVIVGATRDAGCGPLVMFGLGGTFVEVMKDVSFRLAPMWRISARKMIGEIRAHKILMGVRGNPPSDVAAIEDILLRISSLLCNHPEISELDINPLIVHAEGEGASVADSRIMLRR